jgi:hypothetical protein
VPPLSKELIEALESGEISRDQLIELIGLEAEALGLNFDKALALAEEGQLPRTTIGLDLDYLVKLYRATPVSAA